MVLHQEAFDSFKASGFTQLPRQRCEGTQNANLGSWQASSSFAKQAAFFGWIVNRHPKLAEQESFMCSFTSAWQLSRNWKQDSFQHAAVYEKLAEDLGEASPLAKLIKKHLKEGAWQPEQLAASPPPASTAFSSFWKKQAEALAVSLQTVLADVAALEENAAGGSLEEAWPAEQLSKEAWEEPAGRFDGSELSLASGFGNLPLDLKLQLAEGIGRHRP